MGISPHPEVACYRRFDRSVNPPPPPSPLLQTNILLLSRLIKVLPTHLQPLFMYRISGTSMLGDPDPNLILIHPDPFSTQVKKDKQEAKGVRLNTKVHHLETQLIKSFLQCHYLLVVLTKKCTGNVFLSKLFGNFFLQN